MIPCFRARLKEQVNQHAHSINRPSEFGKVLCSDFSGCCTHWIFQLAVEQRRTDKIHSTLEPMAQARLSAVNKVFLSSVEIL